MVRLIVKIYENIPPEEARAEVQRSLERIYGIGAEVKVNQVDDAAALRVAAEVLKRRFGAITTENERKALESAAERIEQK